MTCGVRDPAARTKVVDRREALIGVNMIVDAPSVDEACFAQCI